MNNKKVLYITFIDENNPAGSGSQVRPRRMHAALEAMATEVRMVGGIMNSRSARQKACRQVREWLIDWRPDICYVEPPSGPFFFHCDRQLLMDIHRMGIPIGLFYRDIYWHFPDYVQAQSVGYNLKDLAKNKLIYFMQWRDLQIFIKACTVLYFPSKTMAKYLKDNFNCKNTDILPPGCFVPEMDKKITGKICTAIYVGGTSQDYGLPMLLEAMDCINEEGLKLRLKVVCPKVGWDIYAEGSEWLSRELPWLEVYHLNSGPELEKLYSQCDFSIIPRKQIKYHHFAFPVKLAEYLSHLLPVVSTNCRESADFILSNGIGLVAEDNVSSFAETLERMADDVELRKKLRDNCVIAREYNLWKVRAQKVIDDLSK